MTLEALKSFLPYIEILFAWLALGAIGTRLEKLGAAKGWPLLEAIGQRIEAVCADLPKLIGGSRLSSATVAELTALAAKKLEAEKAPSPKPPGGAGGAPVGLAAAFLLAVTLCLPITTSCSSELPQLKPEQRFPIELAAVSLSCRELRASGRPMPDEMALWCDRLLDDEGESDAGTDGGAEAK